MFKGKVGPVLFCIASHSHPENHRLQGILFQHQLKWKHKNCWRKNRTTNHSKAKLQLSHSLTNRKPWWRFRKHGDALQTKVVRKRCAEKVARISNSHRKMPISKAKVTNSLHKRSLSHCLAFLLKGFLTYLTRGEFKGCECLRELCLSHLSGSATTY